MRPLANSRYEPDEIQLLSRESHILTRPRHPVKIIHRLSTFEVRLYESQGRRFRTSSRGPYIVVHTYE